MSPGIPSQVKMDTKWWIMGCKGKKGRGRLGVSERRRAERWKEFKGKAVKTPPDTACLSTGATPESPVGIFLIWELAGRTLKTVSKEIGFSCRISTGFSDTEPHLSWAKRFLSQFHHQLLLLWWVLMAQIRRNTPLAVGNSMGSQRTGLEGSSADPPHSLRQDLQTLLQLVLKIFPCWNLHGFPRQADPDLCPKLIRKLSSQLT